MMAIGNIFMFITADRGCIRFLVGISIHGDLQSTSQVFRRGRPWSSHGLWIIKWILEMNYVRNLNK